jgi:hypothetical protein
MNPRGGSVSRNRGSVSPEYTSFLHIMGIKSPEIAFVNVKKAHIQDIEYPYHYFNRSCFDSLYHQEYKDVDYFFKGMSFSKA